MEKISVVVPCYNEEKSLPFFYDEMKKVMKIDGMMCSHCTTAITKADIKLTHLMDFTYYLDDCYVEVYVGKLNKEVFIEGDENDLYWSGLDKDFFDETKYAGEGNIGHIMKQIEMARGELLV